MKISNFNGVNNATDDTVLAISYTTDGGTTYQTKKIRMADMIDDFSVSDLADVSVTTPATGAVLRWDGSQWVDGGDIVLDGSLSIGQTLSLGASGAQFFAFNEDSIKVKYANWYSSNTRQYGQGQLWYEQWFGAIDDQTGASNRRIGFYLDTPNAGASNAVGGTGVHPTNDRMHIDLDGVYIADDLNVNGDIVLNPSSSQTPSNNGELVIEATNNTTLTFKLKGSDGTVRTGTLTLS